MHFDFDLVSKRFEENYMVLNADKCQFTCLGKDTENETFIFNSFTFSLTAMKKKYLRLLFDNKLTFKSHIKT